MLMVKEILRTAVADGSPQRLQRWPAVGAASDLSVPDSYSSADCEVGKIALQNWEFTLWVPLCYFPKRRV